MGVAQAEALGPVLAGVAVGGAVTLSGSVEMGVVVGWDAAAALYTGWLALFVINLVAGLRRM